MEKEKIAKVMTYVTSLLTIISVVVKDFINVDVTATKILVAIFGLFLVISLGFVGYYHISGIIRERKGKQSSSVIKVSTKYINKVKDLAKGIDKKLDKVFKVTLKTIEKEKKTLDNTAKRDKEEAKDLEKRSKYFKKIKFNRQRYFILGYSNFVLKDAKNEEKTNLFFEESKELCEEIISLSRILLELDQYHTRIKLGEFVAKYSTVQEHIVKAYADLIGFSYILKGEFEKGKKAIDMALELIDDMIANAKTDEEYVNAIFWKCRCYRHLSTTYYTYEKNANNMKNIVDCEKILNTDERLLKYYKLDKAIKYNENDDKKAKYYEGIKLEYDVEYYRMKFGYDTNKILHLFYDFYYKNDNNVIINANKYLDIMNNDIKMLELMQEKNLKFDRHRYVKLLALKLQFIRVLKQKGIVKLNNCNLDEEDIDLQLSKVENVFGDNIYFDDAFEMYTNEKVFNCFKKADKIINKK